MENNDILLKILSKLDSVDSRLERVENRLEDVEHLALKTQVTLENDISKKLNALFDGHALNAEKLDHISQTVDDIESSVVALDVMNKVNTDEIIKLKIIK